MQASSIGDRTKLLEVVKHPLINLEWSIFVELKIDSDIEVEAVRRAIIGTETLLTNGLLCGLKTMEL